MTQLTQHTESRYVDLAGRTRSACVVPGVLRGAERLSKSQGGEMPRRKSAEAIVGVSRRAESKLCE